MPTLENFCKGVSAISVQELPVGKKGEVLVNWGFNFKFLLIYKVKLPCRIISKPVIKIISIISMGTKRLMSNNKFTFLLMVAYDHNSFYC